ncbi:ABC transporter permease, partial [Mesorhizobium sp. M8A.F.Ca.ET.059.01.1.1]
MIDLIQLAVPVLLKGLWVTAALTFVSVLIGFNLGLGLALMRLSSNWLLSGFAKYYSNAFRGTPLLVQIFLFYYGLGQLSLIKDNAVLWWVIS